MSIKVHTKNRLLVVAVEGDLDHHSAEDIRRKVDREFELQKCKYILFDLHKVDFMDSSGIGMLVCRHKMVKEKCGDEGRVYVTNINGKLGRIFELSGLDKIITRINDVEEIEGGAA